MSLNRSGKEEKTAEAFDAHCTIYEAFSFSTDFGNEDLTSAATATNRGSYPGGGLTKDYCDYDSSSISGPVLPRFMTRIRAANKVA